MIRAAFVMEQHIGHRTFYLNVRQYVESSDSGVQAGWIEVAYQETGSFWEQLRWVPERWKGTLRGCREVRRGLAGTRFDVAFFNTQVPAGFALDRLLRLPYVLSTDITPVQYDALGDLYSHTPDRPGLVRWLKHQANRTVFRRARRVVTWSNWTRRSVEADYGVPPDRIEVVPPGVDLEMWGLRTAEDDARTVRILFVGGDFVRKGGPMLLEAYRRVGAGRAELDLVTRDEVRPEPGVHVYRGLTPNSPALLQLYRSSHIFVLPTTVEAFGIAAVEASASGLPVIATRVGGLADIVVDGETGVLVPLGDVDALAQALSRLLDDPAKREQMGHAARKRAEARFDTRANSARLVALLREAAG